VRRTRYRGEVREQLERERAATGENGAGDKGTAENGPPQT